MTRGAAGMLVALVGALVWALAPAAASAALLQQGPPLTSGDPSVAMGARLAVSADGNTALLSGELHRASAFVFVRSGATWTRQAELVPAGGGGDGNHPPAVALSADGNTAVIGAEASPAVPGKTGSPGAAFVFVRDGATWRQQARLGPDEGCCPHLGAAVAISGDGSTIVAGAPYLYNSGAAYFYARNGDAWTPQGSFILGNSFGTAGHVGEFIGGDVALSGDGGTALVGSTKRPYVLTRAGGTWSAQDTGPQPAEPVYYFGGSVALSDDATTALIGGDGGPRWFTRPDAGSSAWTQVGPPLAAWGPSPPPLGAVALSRDGRVAIAGAPGDYLAVAGTAWTFQRIADGWGTGTELQPGTPVSQFGLGVGLSGDGRTALVGGRQDTAFAFARIPTVSAVTPATGSVLGGGTVTIAGDDLAAVAGVLFGKLTATSFHLDAPDRITAVAPAAAPGAVHVTVAAPTGISPSGAAATYTYVRPVVTIASRAATLGRRAPSLRLTCATADCAGVAQLVSIVVAHGGKRTTVVARAPYRLAAGRGAKLALKPTPEGRRLAARARGRALHLTARATVAGGVPVARSVTARVGRR